MNAGENYRTKCDSGPHCQAVSRRLGLERIEVFLYTPNRY